MRSSARTSISSAEWVKASERISVSPFRVFAALIPRGRDGDKDEAAQSKRHAANRFPLRHPPGSAAFSGTDPGDRSIASERPACASTRHSAWHIVALNNPTYLPAHLLCRVVDQDTWPVPVPVHWRTASDSIFAIPRRFAAICQGLASFLPLSPSFPLSLSLSLSLSVFLCLEQKRGRSMRTVASFTLVTHQRQLRAGNFNCASIQPALVPRTSLHSA